MSSEESLKALGTLLSKRPIQIESIRSVLAKDSGLSMTDSNAYSGSDETEYAAKGGWRFWRTFTHENCKYTIWIK